MAKNSKRDAAKQAARAAECAAKKSPKVFWTLFVLFLIVAIAAAAFWYFAVYRRQEPSPAASDELQILFPELGNKYAGDCTLVKVGDTEVLIDAGSRAGSAATLVPKIGEYCTDGVLEYVIATHAHQDHIAAFVGTKAAPGVFASFECEVIIDFARTNTTSGIYNSYVEARDEEVAAGAKHYTALDCVNETNGASKRYELAEGISFEVLSQRFYEEKSSDENNYSVCTLFTRGEDHFIFTGDLEKEGEESLAERNFLPHCKLFKGGHHGSPTSSNECLLEEITPEVVCVCCCAGAPEYTQNGDNTFPSQAFVDRVARYTKEIYVTTLATNVDLEGQKWDYTSMNGDILVRAGETFSVTCSKNMTVLKDTDWFKRNRVWPQYGVK